MSFYKGLFGSASQGRGVSLDGALNWSGNPLRSGYWSKVFISTRLASSLMQFRTTHDQPEERKNT